MSARRGLDARGGRGAVASFDREVGLGEIVDDAGERVAFHCIEIADGSRDIEVGTAVVFEFVAKLGRYEAAGIRPA